MINEKQLKINLMCVSTQHSSTPYQTPKMGEKLKE
jgi:hypothetical protein